MTKIKFTSGTIEKLSFDYYNIILFNQDKEVYRGTISRLDAATLINKHDKKMRLIK